MTHGAFDRFAVVLGAATSRRAGIAAVLAAAIGVPAAAAGPGEAGQCGTRKTSACTKDSDCCNGRCNMRAGKTNKDGMGRCRCSRRNEPCATDVDCCSRKQQGMICVGGVCGSACTNLGETCGNGTACCAGSCDSTNPAVRGFASPVCCLAIGESGCTAAGDCCGGAGPVDCVAGVCAEACKAIGTTCSFGDTCCNSTCGQANRIAPAGIEVCCVPQGGSCSNSSDCCGGIAPECSVGTCTPL